jgi:protein-L-isoaspartate O-methyltransferase
VRPEAARAELLAQLVAAGDLEPSWRDAFDQVPRHEFVPDVIWRVDPQANGRLVPLRRADDPDAWLAAGYANRSVETQVDDGHPAEDGTGWEVTSSSSQPSVVASMLRVLDLRPGMRVLEIGTGTGWNAGLAAYRVGAENVVSVEVDPVIAELAREALDRVGYGKVRVITGDGALGWADGGRYDRVIATVGVAAVPVAWVEQTVPGGRVVAPLTNTYRPPGVVVLDVAADGTATGRLAGDSVFMGMRADRTPRPTSAGLGGTSDSSGTTELHPWRWAGERAAAVAIGQRLAPGLHLMYEAKTATTGTQWVFDPSNGSWASVDIDEQSPPYKVEQAGPRRPFDEVTAGYQWWLDAGSPQLDAWRITVTEHGQTMSLATLS